MTMVTVTFEWSDEKGECSDCGLPAAYELRSLSSRTPGWSTAPVPPEALLCSVCAAMAASRGETIVWLFEEEDARQLQKTISIDTLEGTGST